MNQIILITHVLHTYLWHPAFSGQRERDVMNWVTFNYACGYIYVFVMLNILQSQFIEKGLKKAENSEQNVVILLFLFALDSYRK